MESRKPLGKDTTVPLQKLHFISATKMTQSLGVYNLKTQTYYHAVLEVRSLEWVSRS